MTETTRRRHAMKRTMDGGGGWTRTRAAVQASELAMREQAFVERAKRFASASAFADAEIRRADQKRARGVA